MIWSNCIRMSKSRIKISLHRGFFKRIPNCYSGELFALIKQMLSPNSKTRPTCAQILEYISIFRGGEKRDRTFLSVDQKGSFNLLNTIKVPIDLTKIQRILPESKYNTDIVSVDSPKKLPPLLYRNRESRRVRASSPIPEKVSRHQILRPSSKIRPAPKIHGNKHNYQLPALPRPDKRRKDSSYRRRERSLLIQRHRSKSPGPSHQHRNRYEDRLDYKAYYPYAERGTPLRRERSYEPKNRPDWWG